MIVVSVKIGIVGLVIVQKREKKMRNRYLRTEFLYNFVKNAKVEDIVIQLQYLDVLDKQNAILICRNNELQEKLNRIYTYLNNSVFLKNKVSPKELLEQIDLLDNGENE